MDEDKVKFKNYGANILSQYFESDGERQFLYETLLGCGKDGVTYLIKRRPPPRVPASRSRWRSFSPERVHEELERRGRSLSPIALLGGHPIQVRDIGTTARQFFQGPENLEDLLASDELKADRIVLKIDKMAILLYYDPDYEPSDDDDEEEEEKNNCQKEKQFLKIFEGCQHIVELIAIGNDPLTRNLNIHHGLERSNWFFEEYLENGTLLNFIERLIEANSDDDDNPPAQLPNRMLWSIFLCLVKMVVGMAWPDFQSRSFPEKSIVDRPLRSIQHADTHEGNLMFGTETDPTFHSILPILKLIDFAGSQKLEDDEERMVEDPGCV
ncbi:hypothetical protein GGR58DRAFT_67756 [Xylaria digitata]|nr:hypothetical protein GGR58DRAFT_67756 [Xylaria digitata]